MIFTFLLTTLAAYRIWRLLAVDEFPPIETARERFEVWITNRFGAEWAAGISCPWCSGAWVSIAVVSAVWAVHPLPLPALWYPAVSAGVGIAHGLTVRLSDHG